MATGLFLSWQRPSREQQQSFLTTSCGAGTDFNYHPKHRGATSSSSFAEANLRRDGFHINRDRVLLGSGATAFARAKSAVQSWRHFGLDWAFVDPSTPVKEGTRFCVCAKELVPWVMMPLQVAYVNDRDDGINGPMGTGGGGGCSLSAKACFSYGSGTLRGHLLAGEERFSVELDENDQVWYEIFSFSKPAHLLSSVAYPYVQFRQKLFARQSTQAVLNHVTADHSSSLN